MGKNIKIFSTTPYSKNNVWLYNTKVEKMTVESLSEVGDYAFVNVGSALQGDIVINEGVTKIGTQAFYNCTGLKTINIDMTETTWNSITKGSNWNRNVTANIVFKK